jgi:phosphoesterase RecJ-like protein
MITEETAAALYTGIITDTGCFRHKSTTPRTLEVAAKLLKYGINFNEIQRRVIYEHSVTESRLLAAAINNMKVLPDIKLAISAVSKEQMQEIGAVPTDLEGIVEYILNTKGVESSALLSEREKNVVHISLRSTRINVRDIAAAVNGGGHIHAAGGRHYGTVEEAFEIITKAMREAYG